jgi:hypothetical protein
MLLLSALVASCAAGCVNSWPLLARNAFASSYWCPVNQIEVRPEPGSAQILHVAGCGVEVTYDCGGTGGSKQCQARESVEYEATDGTTHGASLAEETSSNGAMSREAATASAAHDLPCDRASVHIVGNDAHGFANVLDGCGQRVTYQIADVGDQATGGHAGPVRKHKYVVLTRQTFPAPVAPAAPPASAAPAAPATPVAPVASVAPGPASTAPPASAAPPATAAPPASAIPIHQAPLSTPQ